MNKFISRTCGLILVLTGTGVMAQSSSSACEQAWSDYNEFKRRTTMAPSEYPLTPQGAAVRAACGADALPAPANVDTPRIYVVPVQPVRPRPNGQRPPTPDEHRPRDLTQPSQTREPPDGGRTSESPWSLERRKPVPPAGAPKGN